MHRCPPLPTRRLPKAATLRRQASRLRLSALLLPLAAGLWACEQEAGPRPPASRPPAGAPAGAEDAPIRIDYLCGNRFILTNAHPFAVTVTYRVQGAEERGERRLPPAPPGDPAFSESEVSVTSDGAVALYSGGELLAVRPNDQTPCEPAVGPAPSLAIASTSTAGQWSAPFPWPIVAVHLHLLRNGRVLSFGKFGNPYVWNPSTKGFTAVPSPARLFCSGHSFLPDGRLLVAGGHISDDHGLPDATIFSPSTQTWTQGAPMRRGRWYPTNTTLGNGEVLTLAGRDQNGTVVTTPEVWTGSSWRALSGAQISLPYYPRTFVAPNGKVFYAGSQDTTRYLSTGGTGAWSTVAKRQFGVRDYGSAVMYLPGKILYAGGGRTTRTAEIIDLNQAAPAWQYTGKMAYARRHLNVTVLPTGEVLATGGSSGTSFNEPSLAVRVAEIWNPATGVWTSVASNAVNRTYHSTSLLLPDARVLHTGSGDALLVSGDPAPDEKTGELYSPPYLFKGARPTISSAPTLVTYGQAFSVGTSDPAAVTKVSWIRTGSVTHAFDMNQRFMWLTFTRQSGALRITAPSSRNTAPPGHYMLFLLNGNGVPSVAKIIQLK
jgi:galactose oxidase